MGRVIAAAAVAAVLAAAGSAAAQEGAPVPYRTLERDSGAASGYDVRATLFVRTQRRWRHVWRRLHAEVIRVARTTARVATTRVERVRDC